MQFSTKARYATRILIRMARGKPEQVWRKQDLADLEGMPVDYVGQILLAIKRAGYVNSIRGIMGGFVLIRNAAEITVADVVEATDGPICLVPCTDRKAVCDRSSTCVVQGVWERASHVLRDTLREVKLADLARRADEMERGTPLEFDI